MKGYDLPDGGYDPNGGPDGKGIGWDRMLIPLEDGKDGEGGFPAAVHPAKPTNGQATGEKSRTTPGKGGEWGAVATGGAAHEAAHGVVAAAYGIHPAKLVLHTSKDGTEWRHGYNEFGMGASAKMDANPLHDAVITAAGAEGHRQWLEKQGVPSAEAERLGVQSGEGDSGVIRDIARRTGGEVSEAGARSVAAAEVARLWPKIEQVANALAERHRLGGWSVR